MPDSDKLVIDADGHVFEPFSVWQEYLDPKYRDQAFRMVEEDGKQIVKFGELTVEMDLAIGDFATPGGLRAGNAQGRGFEDIHPGATEPKPRLALMDEMGIDVSVLYPTALLTAVVQPDGFRQAMLDAYGRYMQEFCAEDPLRLKWVAPIPRNDVADAVHQVERAVERGACAVFTHGAPTPDQRLLGDPRDDAFIDAVTAAGVGLGVHVSDSWTSPLQFRRILPTRLAWDTGAGTLETMLALLHTFANGLLDRKPELRIAFLEGNVGWFPYWIRKIEGAYENFGSMFPKPAQTPLEQFAERCWISGEIEEPELAQVVELIGADRCLWATDFPHYEASWDPVGELDERTDLTAEQKAAMLHDAPVSFYGFTAADLPERASA